MSRARTVVIGVLTCAVGFFVLVGAAAAPAAAYPTRVIEVVVPYGAGGGGDLVVRAFVAAAAKHVKVPMNIVNKVGAGGAIGSKYVADAAPDGYTIGMGTTGSHLTVPMIQEGVGYSRESFKLLSMFTAPSFVVVVRKNAPWKTWGELLAYMKQNPNKITYGSSGVGASIHFLGETLATDLGFSWRHVPFDGTARAEQAVMGGHIDAVPASTGSAVRLIASGKIRPLVTTSEKRIPALPDVPTLRELNTNYTFMIWYGFFALAKTPDEVVKFWEDLSRKVCQDAGYIEQVTKIQGGEPPACLGSADFKAKIQKDNAALKPIADAMKTTKK